MKYRDQFLKLALETGVIQVTEDRVTLDPYFLGNGHLLRLAALACREAINDPKNDVYTASVYVGFESEGYPLLASTAMEFRGGDARGFIHRHQFTDMFDGQKYREATKQRLQELRGTVIIVGTLECETTMAVPCWGLSSAGLAKHNGIPCSAAVFLYSSCVDQQNNRNAELPIVRVLTEQHVRAKAAELKELELATMSIDDGRRYRLPG